MRNDFDIPPDFFDHVFQARGLSVKAVGWLRDDLAVLLPHSRGGLRLIASWAQAGTIFGERFYQSLDSVVEECRLYSGRLPRLEATHTPAQRRAATVRRSLAARDLRRIRRLGNKLSQLLAAIESVHHHLRERPQLRGYLIGEL